MASGIPEITKLSQMSGFRTFEMFQVGTFGDIITNDTVDVSSLSSTHFTSRDAETPHPSKAASLTNLLT